jgi:hypothetical protein
MKNLSPAVGVHATPACWSRWAKSRLIIDQVCIPTTFASSRRGLRRFKGLDATVARYLDDVASPSRGRTMLVTS